MSNILPAVFGLLGVILGGVIASGSSYWLETRRERREREKDSRARAASLRQAARLIDEEFLTAISCIQFALQEKRWGEVPILEPRVSSWQQYHAVLAMELSTEGWCTALKAHLAVKQLIHLRAISGDDSDTGELRKDALELAESLRREIDEGRRGLIAFSTSQPLLVS
jgi:hypothetical protein